MTDLAAQTGLSTSGITGVVDRLQARELVQRELDTDDRRSWLAVLTTGGYELLSADLPPLLATIQEYLVDILNAEQLTAFTHALRELRHATHPLAWPDASPGQVGRL